MNIKEVMVLIKGEDETQKISNIDYDHEKGKVKITYQNSSTIYPFNQNNVVIINEPEVIELNGQVAYVDGVPVYKPRLILKFREWIRIIKYDGESYTIRCKSFSLIKDGTESQDAQQILSYLRDISQYTSDNTEEDAFLKKEMDKLTFVHPESVLSRYLNRQEIEQRTLSSDNIIFPFKFNLSQKAAIEKAFTNSISVIEGPPGTGKTQTILNIIANLVAVHGKSVAVVSNNNEAVKNIIEKMANQGYDFLTALLGKKNNQEAFFANMPVAKVDEWDCEEDYKELVQLIEGMNDKLNGLLRTERKKAQLLQELRAWQLEHKHFEEYYSRQNIKEIPKLPLFNATPDRIVSFLVDTSLAKEYNQSDKFLYKLKLLFKYGIFDYKNLKEHELDIFLSLQGEFYRQQISKLEIEIDALKNQLDNASFDELLENHQKYSEKLFRKYLYQSHGELTKSDFTKKNFKLEFQDFIKNFPIILSTTHALRRSIPENYLLDYVIIDEASQVDLITGSLAFSCCRNVIIVGDVKQLPQITIKKIEAKLKTMPPHPEYNYFQNNILSSIISLYGDSLPCEILREHYRCHPQIIEFCNKKYYDGELISYTSPDLSENPLVIYKTVEGNHMRSITRGEEKGIYNQRELDVTVKEILANPNLADNNKNIGFVTPYRKQANKGKQLLPDSIESDTVHKYQGREKEVMIMSTVLSSTKGGMMGMKFVDDPQLINVAVSRAIKQFVLVTDHEFLIKKGKDIGDLIRYIQYSTLDENIIESNIVSVFDLLYQKYSSKLIPLKAKMDQSARYKSEEAINVLLDEIFKEPKYNRYIYVRQMLLRNLLNNVDLLTPDELKFVNNRASLDFVVYYRQDKACALVIEVDGFTYHENNPEQLRRDALKDSILAKYEVPILRLATNGSSERERIQKVLEWE